MALRNNQSRYDERLFARAAKGPMTAKEIAAIMGVDHAPDAVKRLRHRKHVSVEIVGRSPTRTRPCNLYLIDTADPEIKRPRPRGWCEDCGSKNIIIVNSSSIRP